MKKALINDLGNTEKMAATEYKISVHHQDGEVIELSCTNYSYSDVFQYIQEYYSDKNDSPVQKIEIKVKK